MMIFLAVNVEGVATEDHYHIIILAGIFMPDALPYATFSTGLYLNVIMSMREF